MFLEGAEIVKLLRVAVDFIKVNLKIFIKKM